MTAFLQAPAQGAWKEEGETTRDEVVLYEVMAQQLEHAWWKSYRTQLERRFRQEAIVVRALAVQML